MTKPKGFMTLTPEPSTQHDGTDPARIQENHAVQERKSDRLTPFSLTSVFFFY